MYDCRMEIDFDPEKAASNLRKHRVSFAHAEQALRDPLGITIEDPDAEGEPRIVTLKLIHWVEFWSKSTHREDSESGSSPRSSQPK